MSWTDLQRKRFFKWKYSNLQICIFQYQFMILYAAYDNLFGGSMMFAFIYCSSIYQFQEKYIFYRLWTSNLSSDKFFNLSLSHFLPFSCSCNASSLPLNEKNNFDKIPLFCSSQSGSGGEPWTKYLHTQLNEINHWRKLRNFFVFATTSLSRRAQASSAFLCVSEIVCWWGNL